MKKIIITLLFCLFLVSTLCGQGIHITFTPEGVRSATENTDLLLSDPLINQATFYVPPTFQAKKDEASGAAKKGESAGALAGASVGAETEVSGPNKSLNIPINYAWKDYNFGLTLPFIMQRKMEYAVESKSAAGIGDISVSAGYNGLFRDILYSANIFFKLPSGDDEKMVDGYLVPMGTGSTDMVLSGSGMKVFDRYSITGSIILKLNGSSEKIAEIVYADDMDLNPNTTDFETINYTIKNGGMFSLIGGYDYFYDDKWTFGGWMVLSVIGEGSTDEKHTYSWNSPESSVSGISNRQDMTLIDLIPKASYRVMFTDLTLMMKIPLVTSRNPNNNEGSRGVTVLLKLGRNL